MSDEILKELLKANQKHTPCALVTVTETKGSVPREPGSKMIVYGDGSISSTVGGGKFESLVIEDCVRAIASGKPLLKTYPLHENDPASFGAICGGESTVYIEPQKQPARLFLVGAGHCSQAIARVAALSGFSVIVIDDREQLTKSEYFPSAFDRISDHSAPHIFAQTEWLPSDSVVVVSRNFMIDKEALRTLVPNLPGIGYVGMIGSVRKVRRVLQELIDEGAAPNLIAKIYSPIGIDIGADSPAEIAISVIAEIIKIHRHGSGEHLKITL